MKSTGCLKKSLILGYVIFVVIVVGQFHTVIKICINCGMMCVERYCKPLKLQYTLYCCPGKGCVVIAVLVKVVKKGKPFFLVHYDSES